MLAIIEAQECKRLRIYTIVVFSFVVKSGEELWRVVRHSSPLAIPVFIGVSGELVKSEE